MAAYRTVAYSVEFATLAIHSGRSGRTRGNPASYGGSDVMIAPATMPAWTPLFASIAAVVTDAGGVLSHAAIVAREYNIPAVLGTGRATSEIKDGQQVEVDGDAGVVRVIS